MNLPEANLPNPNFPLLPAYIPQLIARLPSAHILLDPSLIEEDLAISRSFILQDKEGRRVYMIGDGLEFKEKLLEGSEEILTEENISEKGLFEF